MKKIQLKKLRTDRKWNKKIQIVQLYINIGNYQQLNKKLIATMNYNSKYVYLSGVRPNNYRLS